MPLRNHTRVFRPLRGGIYVLNPLALAPGTLGAIARDDVGGSWIISCYHVLARHDLSPAASGEPIYQPTAGAVAELDTTRSDKAADFAAAKIVGGVTAVAEIVAVGALVGVKQPTVGMIVVKSGMATGLTEGVIHDVQGDDVLVRRRADFPKDYQLTEAGDSGAIWIETSSRCAVAMNLGLGPPGSGIVRAFSVPSILSRVDLALP